MGCEAVVQRRGLGVCCNERRRRADVLLTPSRPARRRSLPKGSSMKHSAGIKKKNTIGSKQTHLKALRCVTGARGAVCHQDSHAHCSQKSRRHLSLSSSSDLRLRTHPGLERSGVLLQMAPPCVYSEGSYWVTADICSGAAAAASEGCGEEEEEGGRGGLLPAPAPEVILLPEWKAPRCSR